MKKKKKRKKKQRNKEACLFGASCLARLISVSSKGLRLTSGEAPKQGVASPSAKAHLKHAFHNYVLKNSIMHLFHELRNIF